MSEPNFDEAIEMICRGARRLCESMEGTGFGDDKAAHCLSLAHRVWESTSQRDSLQEMYEYQQAMAAGMASAQHLKGEPGVPR